MSIGPNGLVLLMILQDTLEIEPLGTIIIGAGADEVSRLYPARDALMNIGIRYQDVKYRNAIAFVARKEYPDFLHMRNTPRRGGPAEITMSYSAGLGEYFPVLTHHCSQNYF